MEPISSKLENNPYNEVVDQIRFLRLIAERLESIKGTVSGRHVHEINNIQGLLLNQAIILERREEKQSIDNKVEGVKDEFDYTQR